jgi:hypothetical protein
MGSRAYGSLLSILIIFAITAGRAFPQVEAASLTIRFAGGSSQFHVGEVIPIDLSFTASLADAYADERERGSSLDAWRARNLLELSVWSLYCAKGRAHARRLYEDAGRDVLGLYSAFEKWGTATAKETDFLALFSSAKQELSSRAAAEGIASLDGDFRRVNEAAEEVGIGEHFRLSYKMLSKFAHPTAMRIIAPPDQRRDALQRDCFFSQGCLYFRGAFDSLENQLLIPA